MEVAARWDEAEMKTVTPSPLGPLPPPAPVPPSPRPLSASPFFSSHRPLPSHPPPFSGPAHATTQSGGGSVPSSQLGPSEKSA